MKVTQPSQERNLCGSCSYRAQHIMWHEGVNAVCLRELILGFPYSCVLDLEPSLFQGVKYLFPANGQVVPSKD